MFVMLCVRSTSIVIPFPAFCDLQALNTCRSFSFNITWFWTILQIFQRFVLTWGKWKLILIWFMAGMCSGLVHSSLKVETHSKTMRYVEGDWFSSIFYPMILLNGVIRSPQCSVLSTSVTVWRLMTFIDI